MEPLVHNFTKDEQTMARAMCKALNIDPEKECHSMGRLMQPDIKYPAWIYQATLLHKAKRICGEKA